MLLRLTMCRRRFSTSIMHLILSFLSPCTTPRRQRSCRERYTTFALSSLMPQDTAMSATLSTKPQSSTNHVKQPAGYEPSRNHVHMASAVRYRGDWPVLAPFLLRAPDGVERGPQFYQCKQHGVVQVKYPQRRKLRH